MLIHGEPDGVPQDQHHPGATQHLEIESLSFAPSSPRASTIFYRSSQLSLKLKMKPSASRVGSGPHGAKFDSNLCSRASAVSAPPSLTPTSRSKSGRNPSTCTCKPQRSQSDMQAKPINLYLPHVHTRRHASQTKMQQIKLHIHTSRAGLLASTPPWAYTCITCRLTCIYTAVQATKTCLYTCIHV